MATVLTTLYGNSAGPSPQAFRVVCQYQMTQESVTQGYYIQYRFYVEVTSGQSSNFTSNLTVTWSSSKYALSVVGIYADTGWVDYGWVGYGSSLNAGVLEAYYTGGSGTVYKSTISSTAYTVPKPTYTITYNANGGSGAPSSQTKTWGTDLTLSTTIPTRSNYTFLGWSESSTASIATWSSGGTYTDNKNATLYAVWVQNSLDGRIYQVLWGFNKGDRDGGDSSWDLGSVYGVTLNVGATYTFTADMKKDIPNGCYFSNKVRVYDASSSSYVSHDLPYTYTQTSSTVPLTAQYDYYPYKYNITYNLNGGINSASNPSTYTVLYGIYLMPPTRDGFIFDGWYSGDTKITGINAGCTGTFSSLSNLYSELATRTTGDITLTAKWKPLCTCFKNVNGTYKRYGIWNNVGGTWKIMKPYKNDNGTWKQCFAIDTTKAGLVNIHIDTISAVYDSGTVTITGNTLSISDNGAGTINVTY